MGEQKPSNWVIGTIVFTMFILGVITMINIAATDDSEFIPGDGVYTEFQAEFNRSQTVTANVDALKDKLLEDGELSFVDKLNIIFGKSFSVLMSIFSAFSFMNNMITAGGTMFGVIIPTWFPPLLISLVISIILFGIISAILQRNV